ncbi:hypothetical protein V8B97DRAFT_1875874 [Scleroderma yunnanense]
MISRKVLKEILQLPLGPYYDRHVLDSKACQFTRGRQLTLYSFVLEHDGRVIGLDESERPEGGNRKFRFRGILNIANPEWLSEFGVKMVEAELNLRWTEWSVREGERRGPSLTLEGLFGNRLLRRRNSSLKNDDGCELSLKVQGERGMPAVFILSEKAPQGLLWTSNDWNRQYEVLTMDVVTYSLSENYFWRYRLLALMKKIYGEHLCIPVEELDPEWFTKQYLHYFAYPKEHRHQRLICDSGDSDLDEERNPRTPRQHLHVHKSEILGLFATHADWLVTHTVSEKEFMINIKAWDKFSQRVKKERRDAARNGISWGWPVGQERGADDLSLSASSEEEEDIVKRNPVIGKSISTVRRKLEIARKKKSRRKGIVESSSSGSESDAGGPAYASDWSYPSDSVWGSDELIVVDKDVIKAIPPQLRVIPDPPDADGRWRCPLPDCPYEIDLRNLRQDKCQNVTRAIAWRIMQKEWHSVWDETVREGWEQMVNNHYSDHFAEVGVKWGTRDSFEWVDPPVKHESDHIQGHLPPRGSLRGESTVAVLHID